MKSESQKFNSLSLNKRYKLIQNEGTYIGERHFSSFQISLYSLNEFYVEVWRRIGLNHIYWIEKASEKEVAENYIDNKNVKRALGL